MRWVYRAVVSVLMVIAVAFVWQKIFGAETVAPQLVSSRPVAAIGSGEGALAVAENGTILAWVPTAGAETLPRLSLESAPDGPRVKGPALEQVQVLAAAPGALSPHVERSYFGESGVDVELSSGIELSFGNASQASRKWRAAAAILASPEVTALDGIDLHAPSHPAIWGSGHTLPPPP